VKRESVRAVGTLLAVFLLGAVVGTGGTVALQRHREHSFRGEERFRMDHIRLRALASALDLSDAQRDRIRIILEKSREQRKAAWDTVVAQCGDTLRQNKESLDAAIRAELTPAQRPRFDELSRRQATHFFSPPPPGR
jgi:hypothetical protein